MLPEEPVHIIFCHEVVVLTTPTLFEHISPLGIYTSNTDRPARQLRSCAHSAPPELPLTQSAACAR